MTAGYFEDSTQALYRVANHESAHGCAHFFYGNAIVEIDIWHPDRGVAGHVIPAPAPMTFPEGLLATGDPAKINAWIEGALQAPMLDVAVCARVGGLWAHDPWDGVACGNDRRIVVATTPRGLSVDAWEACVEYAAEKLVAQGWFRAAARALAGELLRQPYEAMSGRTAFGIIEAAIREYDRVEAGGAVAFRLSAWTSL